jgi:hypothetical protein
MKRMHLPLAIIVMATSVASRHLPVELSAQTTGPEVSPALAHAVSLPLRDIPTAPRARALTERPLRVLPVGPDRAQNDPIVQSTTPLSLAPIAGLRIAGVGNGDYGFTPNAAPPDTNGAAGATQYVQWVNESFAVFDKATGAIAAGFPKTGNTIFAALGGGCANNNDGDPITQYDKAANRWVLTQFSVSTRPYLQCVAVSTTSDATGSYNLYAFSYGTDFPDYPKLGVWPDAYYITFNIFANGQTFAGPKVCAYDRAAMLAGGPATQQCFQLGTNVHSLLPSDIDGPTAPPAGEPNVLARFDAGTNALQTWRFHVDWTNPANTTLAGPTALGVAPFTRACGGGTCVPQTGTRQTLDSLADRVMYRFSYRNFGGYESRLINHAVSTAIVHNKAAGAGIRWYELRGAASALAVFQQGTYAPDSTYRWMGSIAQDRVGNIAVGYSASSSAIHPAVRLAARAPGDPLGTLSAETSVIEGAGSQLRNLSRWGDYSALTVDPVNDCTFWYTNQYLKANGTFNWSTVIASFKLPGC